MPCAISPREFPKVVNDLERLHFSSNVQSVFKKESNTNPALIVKMMEAVPRNQRVRNGTQEETLIRGGDPLALLKYMDLVGIGEWRPTACLGLYGRDRYVDLRPVRFTVNDLHYECTPSPSWFPNRPARK